jgi:hypothetical protein
MSASDPPEDFSDRVQNALDTSKEKFLCVQIDENRPGFPFLEFEHGCIFIAVL